MPLTTDYTPGVSLRGLLDDVQFVGAADIRATSCSCDSRLCRPGDLFVAIAGGRADGHDYVGEAIARGAAAVVAQQPLQSQVPLGLVPDSREALGRICQALAGEPSHKLSVIGVTGTNGKTTTSHLIAGVLRAAGFRTAISGTLGCDDTVDQFATPLTTPSAPALADWLGRSVGHGASHAVLEISSHAIAERRIAGLALRHVCLTNLGRDHLDYHGTLANYHRTKIELFGHLAPGGIAVVNVDDPVCRANAPLVPGGVLTIGMHEQADVTAQVIERFKSEQTFLLSAGNVTVPLRTHLIGDHNVYNCLMATAVGLVEGIDLPTIVRGLESVSHVSGRLERIECGQPFGAFVDFAHTPEALSVALRAIREVTPGRVICVFGAGGNRDAGKRPLMGRVVESLADVAIVTTDNARLENPQTIAADIVAGFTEPASARWMPERVEAIRYALSLAGPDDSVLVAGRGHEAELLIGQQRIALDDRDVVRRWLYNLEPASRYGTLMSVANS